MSPSQGIIKIPRDRPKENNEKNLPPSPPNYTFYINYVCLIVTRITLCRNGTAAAVRAQWINQSIKRPFNPFSLAVSREPAA